MKHAHALITFIFGFALWVSNAQASTLISLNDATAFNPFTFGFTVTAASPTSELLFAVRQDPSYFELTNISVSSSSGELISNGDFHTGDFTGYTLGGNTGFTGVGPGSHGQGTVAFLGAIGSDTFLSQTFATTVGQTYTVSFSLANDGGATNDFSASLNSVSAVPIPSTFPMLGASLLGLGLVGFYRRRLPLRVGEV